jgi:DNA-binding response OmpR family regulator
VRQKLHPAKLGNREGCQPELPGVNYRTLARILVVEDYPPLAKVMAIGLRRHGHEVERAGSLQRAIETAGSGERELDLAILDVDLPDGSGIDLAEQLLELGRVRRVVFFSASHDPDAKVRALQLGPYIEKNETVDALFALVNEELADLAALAKAVGAPDTALPRATARSGTRRKVRR